MAGLSLPSSSMPEGSKLWVLDLGNLNTDTSGILAGSNTQPYNAPIQAPKRRDLTMIAALIHHPDVGLILYDTGSAEDVIGNWDKHVVECTPRTWQKEVHGLAEAIHATGAGEIGDVKAVVMSHLHMDHAGGLENFLDTSVEIWCHEAELKNAFWACATGIDGILYLPEYLQLKRLNWKTFNTDSFEIWRGVTLHRCSGHTEGSIAMELELPITGTVVMTGDMFHVKENYEQGWPHGSLMRDFNQWHRSRTFLRQLVARKKAKVLLGHDPDYFIAFPQSPLYQE